MYKRQHVLRAVREIDDVEQAENDRQAKAEDGVERAVDQADQELAAEQLGRDAEDFHATLRRTFPEPLI